MGIENFVVRKGRAPVLGGALCAVEVFYVHVWVVD